MRCTDGGGSAWGAKDNMYLWAWPYAIWAWPYISREDGVSVPRLAPGFAACAQIWDPGIFPTVGAMLLAWYGGCLRNVPPVWRFMFLALFAALSGQPRLLMPPVWRLI